MEQTEKGLSFEKKDKNDVTLDSSSKKGKLVREGKTKQLTVYDDNIVRVTTKNILTAFNSLKQDELNVAKDKTIQTCEIFKYLEKHGIETSFVEQLDDTNFVAKQCSMLPYECVVRRRAYGSFLKRELLIEEGTYFHTPIKEFYSKLTFVPPVGSHENLHATMPTPRVMEEKRAKEFYFKNGEWTVDVVNDPLIYFNWNEWRENDNSMDDKTGFKLDFYRPDRPYKSSDKLMTIDSSITPQEYNDINNLMLNVFGVLEEAWKKFNVELIDLKIEVGYDFKTGKLLVSDVIDNDSWRIWLDGNPKNQLDKQSYRDGESIDSVVDKYHRVTEYVSKFND